MNIQSSIEISIMSYTTYTCPYTISKGKPFVDLSNSCKAGCLGSQTLPALGTPIGRPMAVLFMAFAIYAYLPRRRISVPSTLSGHSGGRIKGVSGAARILGMNPSALYSRIQKLGIILGNEKGEISS